MHPCYVYKINTDNKVNKKLEDTVVNNQFSAIL